MDLFSMFAAGMLAQTSLTVFVRKKVGFGFLCLVLCFWNLYFGLKP